MYIQVKNGTRVVYGAALNFLLLLFFFLNSCLSCFTRKRINDCLASLASFSVTVFGAARFGLLVFSRVSTPSLASRTVVTLRLVSPKRASVWCSLLGTTVWCWPVVPGRLPMNMGAGRGLSVGQSCLWTWGRAEVWVLVSLAWTRVSPS